MADFKEFLLAIGITTSTNAREKLKWAFRVYDVDGNGVVGREEMAKILQGCNSIERIDVSREVPQTCSQRCLEF